MATRQQGPEQTPPLAEMLQMGTIKRSVRLQRTELENTEAAPLWLMILKHSESMGFDRYAGFIDKLLCQEFQLPASADVQETIRRSSHQRRLGLDPYQLLRLATEAFLLTNAGAWRTAILKDQGALEAMLGQRETLDRLGPFPDANGGTVTIMPDKDDKVTSSDGRGVIDPGTSYHGGIRERLQDLLGNDRKSYIDTIFPELQVLDEDNGDGQGRYEVSPFCMLGADPTLPALLELIWSYWHEEGMLCQTLNAIARRFQNVRRPGGNGDPLAEFELASLRPLSSVLWGYINDEPNRLSVLRRAYEYHHHYGLSLHGRATAGLNPADTRSRFIESFHELLRRCAVFYQQEDDTTVVSDGFPILNALKEVHMILAEGAHNQFRDLPWTARVEMLIEQWFMARPEMKDFLRGRWMVPYPEGWMGGVDAMKRVQGWSDVSVLQFRDLGVYGERLLLSIRYYAWMNTNDQENARTWARFWRPEVQSYLHAYRAATGVDLASVEQIDGAPSELLRAMPSELLRRRLAEQHSSHQQLGGGTAARGQISGSGAAGPLSLPAGRSSTGR